MPNRLLCDAPTLSRGCTITPALPIWPPKDPTNTRVFSAEFRDVLCGNPIRSASVRATPPVLPLQCTVTGSIVLVVLAGGANGQVARVEITVTLEDGETDTRAIRLPIVTQGTLSGDVVTISPTTAIDATGATPEHDMGETG